ncbi:hypothetical protein NDU88_004931 [Pleurodeles waltl]|uniref:Uncharacterized protein n=1 Tax=Pleurodeles waltl TaxID=8319 RepID=A0AAV7WXC5_PLEWA|nr:hypothetical protein NDU88_004931 [Pleurodeles waltl]
MVVPLPSWILPTGALAQLVQGIPQRSVVDFLEIFVHWSVSAFSAKKKLSPSLRTVVRGSADVFQLRFEGAVDVNRE